MYVPDKLKLNKFRLVRIPSNAEYFRRYGAGNDSKGVYSGDEMLSTGERKIDSIAGAYEDYQRYAKMKESEA